MGIEAHIARTIRDLAVQPQLADGEEWGHVRQFLTAAQHDPFADHLRWLSDGELPVASVQVFLHRYRIGQAEIGMCLPEYPFVPPLLRGRGYFKAIMSDLLQWMPGHGYPLAYDHGRKGLYTGIGFAPCFHHALLIIRVEDAERLTSHLSTAAVSAAKVEANAKLFRVPHPLGRGLQCRDELWTPDAGRVRIVPAKDSAQPLGFIVFGGGMLEPSAGPADSPAARRLTVTDAWAETLPAAGALLLAAAKEAREVGCRWLRVSCRPEGHIARAGILAGGELRSFAAQERDHTSQGEDVDAFYLADLRLALEQLLPELNVRWRERGSTGATALGIQVDGEESWLALAGDVTTLEAPQSTGHLARLPRQAMAQAIMGYAAPSELQLIHSDCSIPERTAGILDVLFPATRPHLIHEGYAFADPDELGLVP